MRVNSESAEGMYANNDARMAAAELCPSREWPQLWSVLLSSPPCPQPQPLEFPLPVPAVCRVPWDSRDDLGGGNQGPEWSKDAGKLTNSGNGPIERQETPGSSSEAPAVKGTET